MTSILLYFFIGVGLSMDAFSLAIIYGTSNLGKKKSIILSLNVGIVHFIMPNIGNIIGKDFLKGFVSYGNIIIGIVFFILAAQIICSLSEETCEKALKNYVELIIFALAVSLDSFTVGMALSLEESSLLLGGVIFSIISFSFTISGLILGYYLNAKIGKISKIIGAAILFILSFKYLFQI